MGDTYSTIGGDKRFIEIVPSKFNDLKAELKAFGAPTKVLNWLNKDLMTEENMTTVIKHRDSMSTDIFAELYKNS